jgi:signal transduction histidine kinase
MERIENAAETTVLIVDDEQVIVDLTSIILRNRGYRVLVAPDAMTGLALVEKEHPELVLLDYMMPGMDGLAALREITARYPETYVLMFTGKGSEELAVEIMKAGASDYILKPFKTQDLVERIEHVLKVRGMELRNRQLMEDRQRLMEEVEAWNLELERRVREKSEALNKVQSEVVQVEKLASLGHLAGGLAHEIRNPLNSISLFVQLIKSGLEEPDKLDYIEKIMKEIDRIDNLLTRLLAASKRPRFEISEVRIDEVIERVLETFRPQLDYYGISLCTDLKSIPPIRADEAEISQIFSNLFMNAVFEMRDGGRLGVELAADDSEIRVRVCDTGKGIPKVFDPFFTTKSSGTGLGLSVVFRIVKTYKGRIEVESTGPTGTIFLIRLPLGDTP